MLCEKVAGFPLGQGPCTASLEMIEGSNPQSGGYEQMNKLMEVSKGQGLNVYQLIHGSCLSFSYFVVNGN